MDDAGGGDGTEMDVASGFRLVLERDQLAASARLVERRP